MSKFIHSAATYMICFNISLVGISVIQPASSQDLAPTGNLQSQIVNYQSQLTTKLRTLLNGNHWRNKEKFKAKVDSFQILFNQVTVYTEGDKNQWNTMASLWIWMAIMKKNSSQIIK